MGIRDSINDKFGWSRKQASITLGIKGILSVICFYIGCHLGKDAFTSALVDFLRALFEPMANTSSKNQEIINTFILVATRMEQLAARFGMFLTSIFNFYPGIFTFVALAALGFTGYLVTTRFSEDASSTTEKNNADVD